MSYLCGKKEGRMTQQELEHRLKLLEKRHTIQSYLMSGAVAFILGYILRDIAIRAGIL